MEAFRAKFGDFELIAGNVATAEGARYLAERGVNGIKVGIGPGGGCTTRLNTNFGVPQLQALVECRQAVGSGIPLIADGGIKRDGAVIEALLFGGDTVMLGNAFAGTAETPGETVHKSVVLPESQSRAVPSRYFVEWHRLAPMSIGWTLRTQTRWMWKRWGRKGSSERAASRIGTPDHRGAMLKTSVVTISYGGAAGLGDLKKMFWERQRTT